ncbi:VanZ family protein [Pontiellaceae bacterium B1224]|nr:VanZ family protein [Pontiellaceae bacterium B1224]
MERWKDKLKLRVPAIGLLAVTLLFWGFYDRYEAVGPPLLESPELAETPRIRGDVSATNGVFTLIVPKGGKTADLRFDLPGAVDFSCIRVSGSIRTENVVQGKYAWSSARLLLIQRDAKGKWIPGTHSLLNEQGTVPWTSQVQEFEVDPGAASAEVVLQMIGESGMAQFKEISAVPVHLKRSFRVLRILFCFLWIGMAVLYFKRCRLDRRKFRILILLNVIVILCGTLMPGEWIEDASEQLKEKVSKSIRKPAAPKTENKGQTIVPKKAPDVSAAESKRMDQFNAVVGGAHRMGHFTLFASLCFLVYCSAWREKQHPIYYLKVGLDILLFAAVSESLQFLTMDRTPGISDWMIDLYGMLLALILFLLLRVSVAVFPKFGKA